MIALITVLVVIVILSISQIAGWLAVRNDGDYPWNWRIFLGPKVYLKWTRKRR